MKGLSRADVIWGIKLIKPIHIILTQSHYLDKC